jgi:chorismate mutase / prephenate dehydratase
MHLSEIREKISTIDTELFRLLDERMELAKQVAEYKSEHHLPIIDEVRERAILENIPAEYRQLWDTMMDISKQKQFEKLWTPWIGKIAIQWGRWSFNEIAIQHFLSQSSWSNTPIFQHSQPEIVYAYTTDEVLKQVARGEVEYGQFAIANSIGGLVFETLESLGSKHWEYMTHYAIPVRHCLMIHPNTKIEDITTIMGHEQAIRQCEKTLDRLFPEKEKRWGDGNLTDNASVAEAVANGKLPPHIASIWHDSLAEIYGLTLIERDIQDRDDNMTTFVLIKKRSKI